MSAQKVVVRGECGDTKRMTESYRDRGWGRRVLYENSDSSEKLSTGSEVGAGGKVSLDIVVHKCLPRLCCGLQSSLYFCTLFGGFCTPRR